MQQTLRPRSSNPALSRSVVALKRPPRVMNVPATVKIEVREVNPPAKILRFRLSERLMHWAVAIPFLVCLASGGILVAVYNPHPLRAYRVLFSALHRISGGCLIAFPPLVAIRHRKELRVYLDNIREAFTFIADDIKWLMLMGIAAVNKKISLPEQGKFNAAEKLNFIMVVCTYPLFIATGLVLWVLHVPFAAWIFHLTMAAVAAPLVAGHIFMATINPETRVGLSGMLTGYVDRHWARHHYARWFRKHFEAGRSVEASSQHPPAKQPPPVRTHAGVAR